METTPQCINQTDNDSFDENGILLPGLPDDLAQRCLFSLSPSLLFSVCHPWRRFFYSLSFPSFFSLFALVSPLQNPTLRYPGQVVPQNTIDFISFYPISSSWTPLPSLPQDPPLHLLHRHPSFLSRSLPIQSLIVSNQLILIAATGHKLLPALSIPLVFNPESNSCGIGSLYKGDVARLLEKWDLNKKREYWRWENKAELKDGRFSREAVEAVGYRGKVCMVNVKGNAVKECAVYNVGLDKWEEMPQGMVAGWNGPAAAMDEDVIYMVDEVKGSLRRYDSERDCWVKVIELEQLKRAEQVAEARGKICAVSDNGERIVVVDVGEGPARFWEVAPPRGAEVVAPSFGCAPELGFDLKNGLGVATDHLLYEKWVDRIPYFLPDLRLTSDMSDSGVGYGQGRINTLEPPFRRTRRSLLTDTPSLSWISFVVKLKSNLNMDDACVHDSLRREVETAGGPFVVKLSLKLDILRREVEIQVSNIVPSPISSVVKLKLALEPGNCLLTTSRPFVVKLNLCCLESNILRSCVVLGPRSFAEKLKLALKLGSYLLTTNGPFVVKLNLRCLESNILRCEVEIGSEIGKLFIDNQRSLRREVELALSGVQYPLFPISFTVKLKLALKLGSCLLTTSDPFVVKLNLRCLESNILRCEVEIGSEIGKLFVDNQRSLRREVELVFSPFVVKLNLRCLESNILRCEVEIGFEIEKLFVDNQRGPFVVKLNLRCLKSNILRCEVEIGSEIKKLFVDNQQSLRREVELALSGVQYPSLGPFVMKLNLRCLESNILRCEVEIGSEIGKLLLSTSRPFVVKLNLCCLEWNDILRRGFEIVDVWLRARYPSS
ncbi:Glutathione S-transferase TAU 8 [Hibiscus syriacus]|uniref:Glutathione S-transferase TAU 8 n=1 Tax=Hibiscus syriacus TaxID=106335 RepID=A0A6A2XDI4_HIBSY|nr:Glutathione S-transferase TAU 8 [Hibiscus syriacus]